MWKDLGLDSMRKGIDFVKRVATEQVNGPAEVVIPRTKGECVMYHIKQAPELIGDCLESFDTEESVFFIKQPSSVTVGDVKENFPIRGVSGIFRFKAHDEIFDYVWLDGLGNEESVPMFRGTVHLQVLVCHAPVAEFKTGTSRIPKTPTPPTVKTPPPDREELVRRRLEGESAKVQAARDFAQQNATEEANRRQLKLESQNALGTELDKWSLTEQGKLKDVRSLLSSMQAVLWTNSGWEPVAMGELMINDSSVKKCYRKAIILCHPDRHQKASADQQYRADRIFSAINESFKLFGK
jgi:hypothetical protein